MKISSKLFSFEKVFDQGQLHTESAEIRQIAELAVMKGGEIKEHIQFCDELTYAVSGTATIYSGDTCREMTAGEVHFIRKGEYHKIVAGTGQSFRYFCIGFQPNPACDSVDIFLRTIQDAPYFFVTDEGNIKKLFEMLLDEFYIRDEESNLMIHFYFSQMLIQLHRILTGKSREKLQKSSSASANNAVYRALQYIDRDYAHITEVKQIARALSYSEYYLSHIFKEKMDVTVKDYLMRKKITAAAHMLQTSNMTVTEIAEQLHFSSLHSFGLAFKRYMGMSAGDFRRSRG
jgi:AraC-like DNA-binding protein/mannose-6-phosphate isomerase-like protein (cupin superfamily)